MKIVTNIIVFVFFFLIVACNNRKSENKEILNEMYLKSSVIYELQNMLIPRDIVYRDSLFIIGDRGKNSMYSVFRQTSTNLNLVDSFGTKGQGPGEFIFPESMRLMPNQVAIFDRSLIRLSETAFPLLDTIKMDLVTNTSFVGLNNIWKLEDDLFVGLTYSDTTRVVVLNKGSLYPSKIGYPDDGMKAPMRQKSLIYQGNLLKHPSRDEFVYSSLYGRIIEFYELDRAKNELTRKIGKNIIFPQYTPMKDSNEIGANFTKDNVTGYLHSCVSDEYVYLLYSGKTIKDSRKNFSNQIDVYDWDGNLIKVLKLDEELSAFCIDSSSKMIYGVTYNEETERSTLLGYKMDNH